MKVQISDADWLEVQTTPELAKSKYGIRLPSFPDEASQISFTGMHGKDNLRQAFSFYKYASEAAALGTIENPQILDFGAGWGRIARLFLRDTTPKNITTSDTMDFAIKWLKSTGDVFNIVQNPPYPPTPNFDQKFDLIYAYSVFSHLSEKYTRAWIDFLLMRLKPNGRFVFTTRGHKFIHDMTGIKGFDVSQAPEVSRFYLKTMQDSFPDSDVLLSRHERGEFQFYPVGHFELEHDCTGETIIPGSFFEREYARHFVSITEGVEHVDQAVVVLKA